VSARGVVRGARTALSIVFWALAVSVLSVGIAGRVGPAAGYELFSIRSGSMEPAVPVGSLTFVTTDASMPAVGDLVAFRLPSGIVVTHRVVEVIDGDSGRFLRTRGDANAKPDPSLVPSSSIVGVVAFQVPLLGFLLALLGMPIGVVTILSVAGTLITAIWLLEEFEEIEDDERAPVPAALGGGTDR
jgi:signal peptidase